MLVTKVGVTLNCTCQHFRYTLCLSLCMHTLCFSAARTCVCMQACSLVRVSKRQTCLECKFRLFIDTKEKGLWPSTLPYLALEETDRLSAQCPRTDCPCSTSCPDGQHLSQPKIQYRPQKAKSNTGHIPPTGPQVDKAVRKLKEKSLAGIP